MQSFLDRHRVAALGPLDKLLKAQKGAARLLVQVPEHGRFSAPRLAREIKNGPEGQTKGDRIEGAFLGGAKLNIGFGRHRIFLSSSPQRTPKPHGGQAWTGRMSGSFQSRNFL